MASWIEPQTRNITKLFREASASDIETAAEWYADAYRIAEAFSAKYGYTVAQCAGVIAAVSPLQSWGANINLSARILDVGGLTGGYLKANLAKATAILDGANIEATLSGQKVVNFYRSILSAGKDGVCIDRHAYSLAVNTRFPEGDIPTLKGKRYEAVVECYTRAARILSKELGIDLTPAQVQSVTWVLWRRKFWAAGAFDSHNEMEN
jgi:hypothetical protein